MLPPELPALLHPPSEDLLTDGDRLREAFGAARLYTAKRDQVIIFSAEDREPPAVLIQHGTAYSSYAFPDGRRAIVDLFLPTDIVGVEHAVLGQSSCDIIAASPLGYRLLSANNLRRLMADPQIAARMLALMVEARWRVNRHVAAITRMDAHARMASFLLGISDRLHRTGLISPLTFNLHLTQEQIGDHLGITTVHVNRTLRRMRKERLAIVDRGVVMILDVERLHTIAAGLPTQSAALHEVKEEGRIA